MTNFTELGLPVPILRALRDEGYETPTPIQAQAIPAVLNGADLLGIAQTGTGKTAAFALPLLSRIFNDKRPAARRSARILVVSPTRELAAQIGESFRIYGRRIGVTVAVVFGGVAHKPQIEALSKGVDVLVATPGRLIDHMETGAVTLDSVEAFVLDEADQMLDLGFVRPIRHIVSKLHAHRQNLFFSATMPHEIAALAAELLHAPVRVRVNPVATTAERVTQRVIHIEAGKKRPFLVDMFADPAMRRTLVFTRTKRGADRVARHLDAAGIPAVAIHGNKSQRKREVALEAFRSSKTGVLVATDIAARGIDIDGVTHVINFELPEVPEAYVHRIGRTARAGADGAAISLCDVAERELLRAIERVTRQQIPAEDRRNDPSIAADAPRCPAMSKCHRRRGARPIGGRPGDQVRDTPIDRSGGRLRENRSRDVDRASWTIEARHRDHRRSGQAAAPQNNRGDKRGAGGNLSGRTNDSPNAEADAARGRGADGAAVAHVSAAIGAPKREAKYGAGNHSHAYRKDGAPKSGARNAGPDNPSKRNGGQRRRRRNSSERRRLETV